MNYEPSRGGSRGGRCWLQVLGSWFLVLGSWFLVLGCWFLGWSATGDLMNPIVASELRRYCWVNGISPDQVP